MLIGSLQVSASFGLRPNLGNRRLPERSRGPSYYRQRGYIRLSRDSAAAIRCSCSCRSVLRNWDRWPTVRSSAANPSVAGQKRREHSVCFRSDSAVGPKPSSVSAKSGRPSVRRVLRVARTGMRSFCGNRNVDIGRAGSYVRYPVETARCGPIPIQQRRRLS